MKIIARSLGFSLGKANYMIKSLTEKGMLKLENFKNSKNKLACHYLLTPNPDKPEPKSKYFRQDEQDNKDFFYFLPQSRFIFCFYKYRDCNKINIISYPVYHPVILSNSFSGTF